MHKQTRCMLKLFFVMMLLVMSLWAAESLAADAYPTQPITMVCGWAAGSMHDTLIRVLSRAAEKELGQPIVNENKPGAGGVIAKSYVLKAKPDGYTLGTTVTATYIVQPQIRKVPYDPFKDVVDIMTYGEYNNGIVVRSNSPWNTWEDVIAYAKANPGKFTYGHPGYGMMPHITMEHIAMVEGIKWQQVPFKNGPEAVNACLGGHIDSATAGSSDLIPLVKAGKMKMLIIISGNHWSATPKVPTIVDKGHDFYLLSYMGIYGPKGLPDPIRDKLDKVFKNAMKDRTFQDMLKQYTIDEAYMSGKDYAEKWKKLYAPMGKLVNQLGLVEK
ncbi:MAG TPA: tripartite tricarboxylate transporter substrate binding protein [Syntrophorhabdales bacterium]|nr:tripartite tricarboxylate transporter substrate binding protein [Syntrophorhabdales bacterium]